MEPREPSRYRPDLGMMPGDATAVAAAPDEAWTGPAVRRVRRWGRMRWEVATRGAKRAVVPGKRCCACGLIFGVGVTSDGAGTLHLPHMQPRGATLPQYDFPLCRDCERTKSLREVAMYCCSAICFVAVMAVGLYAWFTNPPPKSMELLVKVVLLAFLAGGLGLILGAFSAWLAGFLEPKARQANRVVEAVSYEFEGYRAGSHPHDHRCFFRFTSETYAHDFAAANAANLMAPRA